MNISQIAKKLGSLGGQERASRLSKARKRAIASFGAQSRWLSRYAVGRIRRNFKYLKAVKTLKKVSAGEHA